MVLANAHIDTFLVGAKFAENAVYVYFLRGEKDKPYDLVFFSSNITWAAITDMTTQFHPF